MRNKRIWKVIVSGVISASMLCGCIQEEASVYAGITQVFSEQLSQYHITAGVIRDINKSREKETLKLSMEKNPVDVVSEVVEDEEITEKTFEPKDHYTLKHVGYVEPATGLNIRNYPDLDKSDVIGVLPFASEVHYSNLSGEEYSGWAVIEYNGKYRYIYKKYLTDTEPFTTYSVDDSVPYYDVSIPYDSRKSYMDYRKITDRTSKQWALQQAAYTGMYGVRMVQGRFCIAVGSGITSEIGKFCDVVLSDGTIIPSITGDAKRDIDSTAGHLVGNDGGAVEFVVQSSAIPSLSRRDGSLTSGTQWGAKVVSVRVYATDYFLQ